MSDTIAAIATARAPSAIGILRLTGTDTVQILDKVFRPKGRSMSLRPDRVMVLGDVLDRTGQTVDSGLAVLFRGPNSYTGEDCAEIHCHGSPVVLQEVQTLPIAITLRLLKLLSEIAMIPMPLAELSVRAAHKIAIILAVSMLTL